jgi:hypothetical protein
MQPPLNGIGMFPYIEAHNRQDKFSQETAPATASAIARWFRALSVPGSGAVSRSPGAGHARHDARRSGRNATDAVALGSMASLRFLAQGGHSGRLSTHLRAISIAEVSASEAYIKRSRGGPLIETTCFFFPSLQQTLARGSQKQSPASWRRVATKIRRSL